MSLVSRDTREEAENRSIWAQERRWVRLYRSPRRVFVTSMDTHAAMRLAVMLQKAAPKARAAISPPQIQMAARSRAGTLTSTMCSSSSGSTSSSSAAVNFTVTPQATRTPWGRRYPSTVPMINASSSL